MSSLIPVTSSTASSVAPTTTGTTATASTTGLSSVSSSMSSAATTAADTSFSGTISQWVSNVVNAVRGFFKSCYNGVLNFFGWGSSASTTSTSTLPGTTTTSTETTTSSTTVWTDAHRVTAIKNAFCHIGDASTTSSVPHADVIAYVVTTFREITDRQSKLEAFQAVQTAINGTEDITRQVFNELSTGMKNRYMNHIYLAHGNSEGRGMGFGPWAIQNMIHHPHAHQATVNYIAELAAGSTTSSSSTASSTTSGSTTSTGTTTSTTI